VVLGSRWMCVVSPVSEMSPGRVAFLDFWTNNASNRPGGLWGGRSGGGRPLGQLVDAHGE